MKLKRNYYSSSLAFRKYSEVLARLAAGGIDSRLVVKVMNCFFYWP